MDFPHVVLSSNNEISSLVCALAKAIDAYGSESHYVPSSF